MVKGRILWDGRKYRIVEEQDRWNDWQAAAEVEVEACAAYLDHRAAEAKRATKEAQSPGLRTGFDLADSVLTGAATALRVGSHKP